MLKHLSKCFIAGFLAILPIAGTILVLGYWESTISGSGISNLPFYFPGLGLLLTCLSVYLLGLITATLAGQWLWKNIDRAVNKVPAIGKLYATLKQILGYGEGEEAVFQEVVMVKSLSENGNEVGLVTNRFRDPQGNLKLIVFVPGAPNPTSGRMVILAPEHVVPAECSVHEALKTLLTIGKSEPILASNRSLKQTRPHDGPAA